MWVVLKYKINELKFIKENFTKILGETPEFYTPKIRYQKLIKKDIKTFEKFILEGYLICKHSKFKDCKVLANLKYTKGLKYFLTGSYENQDEIVKFVNKCKNFEDKDGYLRQDFFEIAINKKSKFISGPFTNMIFEIISKQKNNLKILMGNITTTINRNNNYQYRPI